MTKTEWFIAWRYLFSRERKALVSLITIIAMAGVAVGVAALLVVIGVMDGADKLLYAKIADLYPHIRIMPLDPDSPVDPELLKTLRARPDVVFAEPIISRQALIRVVGGQADQVAGVELIGADSLGPKTLFKLGDEKEGAATVHIGLGQAFLGAPLASMLRAWRGAQGLPPTKLNLLSNNAANTANGPVYKSLNAEVAGYFNSNFFEFDSHVVFVSVEEMHKLYGIPPGGYDYIHVKLKDPFDADNVLATLHLPLEKYRVRTWSEENGTFFGALRLEKLGLFIILLLIILVAAFNIIGTLILMVIEKTREIGILRAVGGSQRLIRNVFLLDGVMIGIVGTTLGAAIGLGICFLIPIIKIQMPAAIYNFDHLPVTVRPLTVVVIVISSMLICTLAAIFPAHQASRLKPVEALRLRLMPPLLEVINIHKSYHDGARELKVLSGATLTVEAGKAVAVVGMSGAGKSTLLHLLGGLDTADEGKILFSGQPLNMKSSTALDAHRMRHVGYVFQFHHLLPEFTALENIMLPGIIAGGDPAATEAEALRLLERLKLSERARHRPAKLSGGEQQRVALARALINKPEILLADEPTGNLDAHTGEAVIKLMWEMTVAQQRGLVIVTHEHTIAARADSIYRLAQGRIEPLDHRDLAAVMAKR